MNGYTGKILRVDLTNGTLEVEEHDELFYRQYLGGAGLIAYYLLKEVPADTDPLGPDNLLIFAGGPMTGVPIAGSGRSAVGGRSPLNGGYGEADVGGFFGAEMRRAGYDAVVVRGQAESPVYLWLHDGEAEIRPADHLWGMTTGDTQAAVRDELGEKNARLALIGPAGEKLVRYACVINDLKHAAGRTGLGAVMGSKKLKCVVAHGTAPVPVADKEGVQALAKFMTTNWKEMAWGMHELGTPGGLTGLHKQGKLPTRNFQDGQFEGNEAIGGEALRDTLLIDRGGCYACPIRCKRVVEVNDADYQVDPMYGGPEYETLGSFGSVCGVDDLRAICKANEISNAYGLDTITAGMVVAFAMECFENELLSVEDTGGLELRFGNGKAMVAMVQQIADREGLGDLLAEGSAIAAKKIGRGAEAFTVNAHNQPFPMHECRSRHGQALGYAVSPTGADHMHNMWDEGLVRDPVGEGWKEMGVYTSAPATDLSATKVHAYTVTGNMKWLENSLGLCAFIPWSTDQKVDIVRAITGWKTNLWELLKAGERYVTMMRLFNMRCGWTREDDKLPARMAEYHRSGSVTEEPVLPEVLAKAVTQFYGMMGWDTETGMPTAARLEELEIAWAAPQMADA
ncbi:MAG: aldehyde ferredoxin oxidoreductase family protein [Anaerolineae bacterium]|nr:aldehyde ferredoxin oxidoreductase family protein [Anaerolineae bacterium]